MRMFKTIKRKVGNAIIPVVGTILALTILAGSVVAVALGSSKIVYRENKLQQQTDARQILYIACKYFCDEKNNDTSDAVILKHLQEAFGPGLRITTDTTDSQKYYIWYPNKYKPGFTEYVPGEDSVEEWLKATILKTNADTDGGDHGKTGMNDVLFSEKAKLDEKFNIGNMATIYMTDNNLLPSRMYDVTMISKVESDIDTFDEAFAYAQGSTTLLIDDIAFELDGYQVNGSNKWLENPEIVYHTGNLGGNYYWQTTANNGPTYAYKNMVYKQEIDDDLMYGFFEYLGKDGYKFVSTIDDNTNYKLKHEYDEGIDVHYFEYYAAKEETDTPTVRSYRVTSKELANALSPYIYERNVFKNVTSVPKFLEKVLSDGKTKADKSHASLTGTRNHKIEKIEWVGERIYVNISYQHRFIVWIDATLTLTYTMNDIKTICNQLGLTTDKIIEEVAKTITITPTEDEIKNKIFELATHNWNSNHQYGLNSITGVTWTYTDKDNWTLEYDLWSQHFTYSSSTSSYMTDVNNWIASLNTTEAKKEIMMQRLKDEIGYNYIPDTTLSEIVGGTLDKPSGTAADDSTMTGYREQAFVSKMLEYMLEHDTDICSSMGITDLTSYKNVHGDYTMSFRESTFEGSNQNGCLDYRLIVVIRFNDGTEKRLSTHLYFKIKTYHPYNTNGASNRNVEEVTSNGRTEYIFSPVDIKNKNGGTLTSGDLSTTLCPVTTLFYKNREGTTIYHNSTTDEKINNNGKNYVEVATLNTTTVGGKTEYRVGYINENYNTYYNGSFTMAEDDAVLRIKRGTSLYINGDLTLRDDQKLIMEEGTYDSKGNVIIPAALLFVNGKLIVEYEYIKSTWDLTSIKTDEINYFKSHGVDILAYGADIYVNGDFDYRGIKALKGALTGAYKQRLMNFDSCTKGTQVHDSRECRGQLKGNFIINGDINFRAQTDDAVGIFDNLSNAFSNPIINATFYADGIFNMRGLWTSGLYDYCRANFVFARSIIQPEVALGTVYDDISFTDGLFSNWCSTNGFLFMIMEDAINFSELNFAAVNMFTPYNMLVGALESNQVEEFNFAEYIDGETFREFYPDVSVMNYWGLPSILRSGFASMYTAGDINGINPEDHVYGNEITPAA